MRRDALVHVDIVQLLSTEVTDVSLYVQSNQFQFSRKSNSSRSGRCDKIIWRIYRLVCPKLFMKFNEDNKVVHYDEPSLHARITFSLFLHHIEQPRFHLEFLHITLMKPIFQAHI